MKAEKHTRRTMFWAMAAALCMGCLTTLVLLMDVHPAIQPYTPLILGTAVSGLLTVLFSCIVLVKALRKPEQIPEAHSVLDPFSLESILLLILCTIPVWWAICKHHESMPKAAFLQQEPLAQCNVGLYAALLCFLSLESLASLLRRIRSGQLAATSLLAAFFQTPVRQEKRAALHERLHAPIELPDASGDKLHAAASSMRQRLNAPVTLPDTPAGNRLCRIINRCAQSIRNRKAQCRTRWRSLPFSQQTALHSIAAMVVILSLALCFSPFDRPNQISAMLLLSLLVIAVYIGIQMRRSRQIDRLSQRIHTISQGDFSPAAPAEDSCVATQLRELDQIQDSTRDAIARQVQAERTKVNLVTNVSHDLKTPLTSLISYIDLLSKEELPPQAMDYVHVLERKSQGLRRMVQDVFDLAKAASGEDVCCTRLDAVMCLRQVLADMEDTIQRSGRDIRLQTDLDRCIIRAEGNKLYRIYQNLLANALRYSMENTRIYIRVTGTQTEFSCCIQNTSSYEMHFTPEEITERFTRGDAMRSTEGSGLGLAIAKSFAEACGGGFRVAIDGDQFKAILTFPCCGSDAALEA